MENAIKALFIAAGLLIGGMILSLGISLYTSLNDYVNTAQENIAEQEIKQFNDQFFKYIDRELTIHDIITVANLAYENNQKYQLTSGDDGKNYYVEVNMTGHTNLEKDIHLKLAELLKVNLDVKYKCSSANVKISASTGRVYEITFTT